GWLEPERAERAGVVVERRDPAAVDEVEDACEPGRAAQLAARRRAVLEATAVHRSLADDLDGAVELEPTTPAVRRQLAHPAQDRGERLQIWRDLEPARRGLDRGAFAERRERRAGPQLARSRSPGGACQRAVQRGLEVANFLVAPAAGEPRVDELDAFGERGVR